MGSDQRELVLWGETMGTYEPLQRYFHAQDEEQIILSFSDIAGILAKPLPNSAKDVGWWANDPAHAEAQAWMDAGYEVAFISLASETVTFIRVFCCIS